MPEDRDLLDRIARQVPPPSPPFERLLERRARKVRNARLTAGAVALLVAVAGTAGAIVALGGLERGEDAKAPAAGTRLVAGPGEYYYSRTVGYFADGEAPDPSAEFAQELWWAPDGSGRLVFEPKRKHVNYAPFTGNAGEQNVTFRAGELPQDFLPGLSTDPAMLEQQLAERSSPGGASPAATSTPSPGMRPEDAALLRAVGDLLDVGEEQLPTPEVQATLFEVARGIDGFEFDPRAIDPVGRRALALRFILVEEGNRLEWYFAPDTRQRMAVALVSLQDDRIIGAVIVTSAGIASSTERPPRAEDLFFPVAEEEPAIPA